MDKGRETLNDGSGDRRTGGRIAVWAPLILVLYFLSVGPVVGFAERITPNWTNLDRGLEMVYSPLILAGEGSPVFRNLLRQYVRWWINVLAPNG